MGDILNWLRRLFTRSPQHNPQVAALDTYWRDYEHWRNAQTCIGCGDSYQAGGKHWVTEYECEPCWHPRRAG